MTAVLPERFTAKTATETGCIVWTGAVNSKGYGCFAINRVSQLAHRVAYEAVHGPIPEGMTLDHLCRVRNCVNVDHLEVVTLRENTRRARALTIGDECSNGHRIGSSSDLYVRERGGTECQACVRERNARRYGASS